MPKKDLMPVVYKCCQCNTEYSSINQFYRSYSGLYSATGRLPICKSCFGNLFKSYTEKYNSARKAMQRLCMAFDLYYNDSLFDICATGEETLVGNYIKRLNMLQYQAKTFDDTLDEGFTFSDIRGTRIQNSRKVRDKSKGEAAEEIDPHDIEKWGLGLEPIDYEMLNSHYKFLINANPNCDSNQEIFIQDLCYTKMQQMKAVREGRVDDYNKLTDSYRKSFKEAGLKAVRESAVNDEFTIGVTGETIEKYTPAEYYKNKELYRDYDNIGGYIERFLLRPLKNLMYGSKDRDYEYFVKEEGDADAITETDEE